MKLAIYARTSTHNGAGSDSLDAQVSACQAWALSNGHEVAAVYRDDALSGALDVSARPGLEAALVAIDSDEADGLVVHRPDRLARELHVQEAALAHAWASGDHVRVFEAAEGEEIKRDDPNDPQRRFLRQVMGAAAELERGLIRARLHGGRRRKQERGGYVGGPRLHPKYGYRLEQGEYVPAPEQQRVIEEIWRLRTTHATYAEIADTHNRCGERAPSGEAWYPMTVMRIFQRESR